MYANDSIIDVIDRMIAKGPNNEKLNFNQIEKWQINTSKVFFLFEEF